jgi:plastocyanin
VFLGGCASSPTVTRSGDVKDIIIGDTLASEEITVNTGDEVRWINKRTAPVRIVFLDPVSDKQLSCKNNIGGLMTPSDTAKLATNETASACFRDPGYYRYTVRMESGLTTGEINVPGVIKVGGSPLVKQVIQIIQPDPVGKRVIKPMVDPLIKRVGHQAQRRRRPPQSRRHLRSKAEQFC